MPLKTLALGFALILLAFSFFGFAALTAEEGTSPSKTILIPAFAGIPFVLLGLIAFKHSLRKHAAHVAAALALLVAFAGLFMGGKGAIALAQGQGSRPLAVTEQLLMGALALIYVVFAVQSFIAARRARKQLEKQAGATA